jgi:hypothetical protein
VQNSETRILALDPPIRRGATGHSQAGAEPTRVIRISMVVRAANVAPLGILLVDCG